MAPCLRPRRRFHWRPQGETPQGVLQLEHALAWRDRDSRRGAGCDASCLLEGGRPAWMTRPYSADLRERALARSEAGERDRVIAQAPSIAPSQAMLPSKTARSRRPHHVDCRPAISIRVGVAPCDDVRSPEATVSATPVGATRRSARLSIRGKTRSIGGWRGGGAT